MILRNAEDKDLARVVEIYNSSIARIFSHNEASLKLFANFGFKQWGELPEVCVMDGQACNVSILGLKVDLD